MKGSLDTSASDTWTFKARQLLDRAGVGASLDGKTYSTTEVANAMFGLAQQKASRAEFDSVTKNGLQEPGPDLMKFIEPPDLASSRAAVAAVVLDGMIWAEAVKGHREASIDEAKAFIAQSTAALKGADAKTRAAVAASSPGKTPEEAMANPKMLEIARQRITVSKEREAIFASAGPQAQAAMSAAAGDPHPTAEAQLHVKALANWMAATVGRHQVVVSGLGAFGANDLPVALTTA
ncbi:MAG: hypothetical protein ACR2GF_04690 [Acidimicrobiales bacterium]